MMLAQTDLLVWRATGALALAVGEDMQTLKF
jgi:hypothetical protein